MSTAIPRWKYRFSSDHRSQATSGEVSTWMGDRLGIPRAVDFFFFSFSFFSRLCFAFFLSFFLSFCGQLLFSFFSFWFAHFVFLVLFLPFRLVFGCFSISVYWESRDSFSTPLSSIFYHGEWIFGAFLCFCTQMNLEIKRISSVLLERCFWYFAWTCCRNGPLWSGFEVQWDLRAEGNFGTMQGVDVRCRVGSRVGVVCWRIWVEVGVNECVKCLRPYHVENTGSRPITEVKQRRARLVLGYVTAWEYLVL